jgi:hypothetical protein
VFVEVAPRGLADNLPHLLEREDTVDDPDTAIFYSITSSNRAWRACIWATS